MDPYLEAPGVWPDFHDSFLAYTREALQPVLPERYYAQLRTREEIGIAGFQSERVMYPDLAVRETSGKETIPEAGDSSSEATRPEILVITADDPLKVSFLEIRDFNDDRLVTLLEMLSPSNKSAGEDRERFERKRKETLESDTSWVEIDLLRAGKRTDPRVDLRCRSRAYHYAVVVSRSSRRHPLSLELYGFTVRGAFPVISVPLREPDADVLLDLGQVFRRSYETGPYRKVLRYDMSPDPELSPDDSAWARRLLDRQSTRHDDRLPG